MTIAPQLRTAARGIVWGAALWSMAMLLGSDNAFRLGHAYPLMVSLTLGVGLLLTGRERVMWALISFMAVCVLVAGVTPLVPWVGRHLVREDPSQPVDAVVVLGAGVTSDGLVSAVGVERMLSGFMRVGPGDTTPMVFSSVRRAARSTTTSEADVRRLAALVGGRRVVLIRDVFSTHDEALEVRALAARRHWQRVAVVTSPSHSSRACRAFEKVGLTVVCWPSAERTAQVARGWSVSERIYSTGAVLYEVLGWLEYRLRGWV